MAKILTWGKVRIQPFIKPSDSAIHTTQIQIVQKGKVKGSLIVPSKWIFGPSRKHREIRNIQSIEFGKIESLGISVHLTGFRAG